MPILSTPRAARADSPGRSAGLAYGEVPPELCDAAELDLHHWSLIVNDNVLANVAEIAGARIRSCAAEIAEDRSGGISRATLRAGLRGVQQMAARAPGTDGAPEWAADTVGLVALNVDGAEQITDYGLKMLADQCGTLQRLDIGGAVRVTDAGMRLLALACGRLAHLSVSGCTGISGSGIAAIGQGCPMLASFRMARCPQVARWALLKVFDGCRQLAEVDLSFNAMVRDEEVRALSQRCRSLRVLNLRCCCHVGDAAVLAVSQHCPDLQSLDVSRDDMKHRITDVGLLALGERSSLLERLAVAGCEMVTDAGVDWLSRGCRALKALDLGGCSKVTNAGMRNLGERCKLLETLNLCHLKRLSDVGVRYVANACRDLKDLNLRGVCMLSDCMKRDFRFEGLQALARSCAALQSLNLSGCFQVSTLALRAIASGCGGLKALRLGSCPRLTPRGIAAILDGCASLELLAMSGCGACVTDALLRPLARARTALVTVELAGSEKLSAAGVRAIARGCPRLARLDLSNCRLINDDAMLALAEASFRPGLRHLLLTNDRRVTDAGLSWLSDGNPTLRTLSVAGTGCSAAALAAVAGRHRYATMLRTRAFFGLRPVARALDRMVINDYGTLAASAITAQRLFRGRKGRAAALRERRRFHRGRAATRLQATWRGCSGRRCAALLRRRLERRARAAVALQCWWRTRRAAWDTRARRERKRQVRCAEQSVHVQRAWRGALGRRRAAGRRRARQQRVRREECAAGTLQRCFRGHAGRRAAASRRRERSQQRRAALRSALLLQSAYRGHVCRARAARRRDEAARRTATELASARMVQAAFRSHRRRRLLQAACAERGREREAAVRLQALYRAHAARARVSLLLQERAALREAAAAAAAAVTLQSLFRRLAARKVAQLALRARRQGEIHDGPASGEARPRCDDCAGADATVECEDCGELFCDECWARVHGGGRRRNHTARALRDPRERATACASPDERAGPPAPWSKHFDESYGVDYYYNSATGESTYERPAGFLE